jgi:hypothetical protein
VSRSFEVVINQPPTISAITDRVIAVGTSTPAIPFTIDDADGPIGGLILSASSSNVALVPKANIVLSGGGKSRSVTVTPLAGQTGTATIAITVSDAFTTTSTAFQLNVRNRPPPPGDFSIAHALP